MATLSRGQTFGATETITNTKLHNLIDLGSITGIVNADIDSNAQIVDTKLADISTAAKVSGAAITGLASVPSAAGELPSANIPVVGVAKGGTNISSYAQGDVPYASGATTISKLAAGTAGQALTTGGTGANPSFAGMTAAGDIEYHNGTTRTRLVKGTSGQVLKMNSAETAPEWGSAGGAGFNAAIGATVVASSNAWADVTGFSVSITVGGTGTINASMAVQTLENSAATMKYRIVYGDTPTALVTGAEYTGTGSYKWKYLTATGSSIAAGTYTVKAQVFASTNTAVTLEGVFMVNAA